MIDDCRTNPKNENNKEQIIHGITETICNNDNKDKDINEYN